MRAGVAKLWFGLCALATSACALTGYDFSDYQPVAQAIAGTPGAGTPAGAGAAPDPDGGGGATAGGDPATGSVGPVTTTFGLGGDPVFGGAGGDAAGEAGEAGEAGSTAGCVPVPCADLGLECGIADNGCGARQNCGACFWWFQECRQNRCGIAE